MHGLSKEFFRQIGPDVLEISALAAQMQKIHSAKDFKERLILRLVHAPGHFAEQGEDAFDIQIRLQFQLLFGFDSEHKRFSPSFVSFII